MAKKDTKKKGKQEDESGVDKTLQDQMFAMIGKINNKFGNVIVDMTKVDKSVKRISTGIIGLDEALGGGWPLGRMGELYGNNSAGKTTTVLEATREIQKADPRQVMLIDAECKLNLQYAEELGVNVDELVFLQTPSIEAITEVVENLVPLGGISAVFIDSLAALSSEDELETDMSDVTRNTKGMTLQKLGFMLKRLAKVANENDTMIVFTNQIRMKQDGYGNPEIRPGGKAPGFYTAFAVGLKRTSEKIIVDGVEIGHELEYYVEKNQTAKPHKTATVKLIWGKGVDRIDSLVEVAVLFGVVDKAGAWYSYKDQKLGQGKKSASETLANNEGLYREIFEAASEKVGR